MVKDLYNREEGILRQKQKFREECEECFKVVENFEKALTLNKYAIGRILKYWSILRRIHRLMGVCFKDAKKEDIERFLLNVERNPNYSEWSKYDFRTITKFFYRWLFYGSLEGEYPDIVKWIKAKNPTANYYVY